MSGNIASLKSNGTEPSSPTASGVPTGYRVAVVPGALEVSARLGTPEEVRNLMKVLRAGIVILEDTTEGDMDEPINLTPSAMRRSAPSEPKRDAASAPLLPSKK
jgi:hypothetical protein